MKLYAIIGLGYVAARHLKAIKETGGQLVAALDPRDSVGMLDSYFPQCDFFTEFELFDRHLDRLRREGKGVDYVVVCSPNYLHDAHCRFGLRMGADVICEKPVVLNPHNIDALLQVESETGKKVNCILQLRLHPDILRLKEMIDATSYAQHSVCLVYVTPRGRWYGQSWKGDNSKSGGIQTNIGIHLFDMLLHVFGSLQRVSSNNETAFNARGNLHFRRGSVAWQLGLQGEFKRRLFIEGGPLNDLTIDFTDGFNDLHTLSYQEILAGRGFTLTDARPAIELVSKLRSANVRD
jgi:UDP-N-acetyl-2-amino-2-deoxyglucuronate dehydrogenase